MKKDFKTQTIAMYNDQIAKIKTHLEMITEAPAIEKHNTIVAWPETLLTVNVKDGKVKIGGGVIAQQFTPGYAAELRRTVSNGRKEFPNTFTPIDFYTRKLAKMQDSLAFLEEME